MQVFTLHTHPLKTSRLPPSFGIRDRTWSAKAVFSLCIQVFLVFNIMTERLNDTNVELVPNDLCLSG